MYRVLDESQGATVGILVQGPFTSEDREGLIEYLRKLKKEIGRPLCLFLDLTKVPGTQKVDEWRELCVQFHEQVGTTRIAISGHEFQGLDTPWDNETDSSVMTVKCFPPGEVEQAWGWVKEDYA